MLKREFYEPLWEDYAEKAFPHLGGLAIEDVDSTAMKIRELRNRIAHHEPLIRRNLSEDYAAILRLLGWICPETREWVRKHASVPAVLRMRP